MTTPNPAYDANAYLRTMITPRCEAYRDELVTPQGALPFGGVALTAPGASS